MPIMIFLRTPQPIDAYRSDEIGKMATSLTHFRDIQKDKRDMDERLTAANEQKIMRSQRLDVLFSEFENDMSQMSHMKAASSKEMLVTAIHC